MHWASGLPDPDFTLVDPPPAPHSTDWEPFVDGALAMRPNGYSLIVIDTVGRSMQGMNENTQEAASQYTALVQALRRELGAATLGVMHTGHGEQLHARGSSVFEADADTVLRVEVIAECKVKLHMPKQKDAPEWKQPLNISLQEVQIDGRTKSLVAVPASRAEVAKAVASDEDTTQADVLDLLDKAVPKMLLTNKRTGWSQSALAQALAVLPEFKDIPIGSKSLSNRYLRWLRESTRGASGYWHSNGAKSGGVWRWVD